MTTHLLRGLFFASLFFTFGCAESPPTTDAAVPADAETGVSSLPDSLGPSERPASLVVPSAHDGTTALPVLVLLHGYTATADAQDLYLGMSRETQRRGFYLILPDGTTDTGGSRFWNATPACCDFYGSGVDDVAYLLDLVEQLRELAPVSDVYFAGHSNGGFMSFRMACEHADEVSAIISLNGSDFLGDDDCVPSRPVSVLQIQGDEDRSVPVGGDPGRHPGASEVVERWAERAGCDLTPQMDEALDLDASLEGNETTVTRYAQDCEGAEVELWTIVGGSHVPTITRDFSARLLEWLASRAR